MTGGSSSRTVERVDPQICGRTAVGFVFDTVSCPGSARGDRVEVSRLTLVAGELEGVRDLCPVVDAELCWGLAPSVPKYSAPRCLVAWPLGKPTNAEPLNEPRRG